MKIRVFVLCFKVFSGIQLPEKANEDNPIINEMTLKILRFVENKTV